MLGSLRVAVEPESGPLDAAPCDGLFDEGSGHQGRLVQEDARQGHPLDEGRAALVLAAHEVEPVFPAAASDDHQVLTAPLSAPESQLLQGRGELL